MRTIATALFACLLFSPSHAAAADRVIARVASVAPEGTPWDVMLKSMTKQIKKGSGGRLTWKAYLGGQKGDEKSLVRQCKSGRLEAIGVSVAALATEVPALQVLELPFLFDSSEEVDFVLDNFLYKPVNELLKKHGFVLYIWTENGWQGFGTKFGFVKTLKAMSGRRIRSQESSVHIASWKAFGAAPVEMGVSEVLPALKTGLVEGFAQTPLYTFAAGWHQGIEYYTLSKHLYQPAIVVYSKKFLDTQSKEDQALWRPGVDMLTVEGRKLIRSIEPGLIQNFVNYGIKVYELSPAERLPFAETARKMRAEFAKTASKDAKKLIKLINKGKAAFQKQAKK